MSNDVANEFGAAVTIVPTQEYTTERAAREYMVDLRNPRSTLFSPKIESPTLQWL